jgi:hypothetical protein
MLDWLSTNGVQPEDLDEVVHEAATSMASGANNEGMRGQVAFLRDIAGWSNDDIKNMLS